MKENRDLKANLNVVMQEKAILEKKIVELNKEIVNYEYELQKYREQLAKMESKVSTMEQRISNLESEIDDYKSILKKRDDEIEEKRREYIGVVDAQKKHLLEVKQQSDSVKADMKITFEGTLYVKIYML